MAQLVFKFVEADGVAVVVVVVVVVVEVEAGVVEVEAGVENLLQLVDALKLRDLN
jgi:hypothetical protein